MSQKFCTECGEKLEKGVKFCESCGAKVEVLEMEESTKVPEEKHETKKTSHKSSPFPPQKTGCILITLGYIIAIFGIIFRINILALFIGLILLLSASYNEKGETRKKYSTFGRVNGVIIMILTILMFIFMILAQALNF